MASNAYTGISAAELLQRAGTLVVLQTTDLAHEPILCVAGSGEIVAFCGHVDLGTGIRTALSQIVAEELDVPAEAVVVVLGDTARTPDQGPTIASNSIQLAAQPLRKAAAQARDCLLLLAARRWGVHAASLSVKAGRIGYASESVATFGELIGGATIHLELDMLQPVKAAAEYRLVGQPQPRVDIPAKASGALLFVHDMRIDGMLHGSVVRPPYAGVDHGPFVGSSLLAVHRESIATVSGIVALVVIGDFIGIVAEREEQAQEAAAKLKVDWKPVPELQDLENLATALRAKPFTSRRVHEHGDVDVALTQAAERLPRRYLWPYQLHASIGPSCALAEVAQGKARIWSGTQNPHELRLDIARLLDLPATGVEVIRMEAAGCYGRNCADDVSADAALLSREVGRPVRVQLTREQEHQWEPKGAAQLIEVDGALDAQGDVGAYDFQTRYPSNAAPTLALLLTGRIPAIAQVMQMGDRTSVPPYDYPHARVTIHDMAPIVRASWLRGVSALPNTFAHECWIDEAAAAAEVDPVEYRLRYLKEERARDVVTATAERAQWRPHARWGSLGANGDVLRGRGFAYALYKHGDFPGSQAAWSAWVADVEVNAATGEVTVAHITNGHDAGLMINPAGVRHQIHGNVIQSVSRVTREAVPFAGGLSTAREWGAYPIISFDQLPTIDTLMINRPEQPPLGAGESASVPSAAAIANAIYDACGVRFRDPPFTPDKIRAGLGTTPRLEDAAAAHSSMRPEARESSARAPSKPRAWRAFLAGASVTFAGLGAALIPWRSSLAPVERPDPAAYDAATVDKGGRLAALGDCIVCHTAVEGVENAGGRPLETQFGVVYSTNITPDPQTGIGNWSYAAFERAMREGIHRDGRHLYPAFPYTHFTQTSDEDLHALYAYFMAQPAVHHQAPRTRLKFPLFRPVMAAWNALFLTSGVVATVTARSETWNRGRYLVEGLGHCAACHSPRNLAGAELKGEHHLTGGWAEHWEAPSLTHVSHAPVRWSKADFFAYLRTGYSALHGSAAGPMAPVVRELAHLPDTEIDAMATYLSSFTAPEFETTSSSSASVSTSASAVETSNAVAAATEARSVLLLSEARARGVPGASLYQGACAVCHEGAARPDLFGIRPSLALNSNLHSEHADNLLHAILDGVSTHAVDTHGAMPGFRDHFDDRQLTDLLNFLRSTFAPDRPPWADAEQTVARIRAQGAFHAT